MIKYYFLILLIGIVSTSYASYNMNIPLETLAGGALPNGSILFGHQPDLPTDDSSDDLEVCPALDENNYYFEMLDINNNVIYTEINYQGTLVADNSLAYKGKFGDEYLTYGNITPFVYQVCYLPNVKKANSTIWNAISPRYLAPTFSNCDYPMSLLDMPLNQEVRREEQCETFTQTFYNREQNSESYAVRDVGQPITFTENHPNTRGVSLLTTCYYDSTHHWDVSSSKVSIYTGKSTAWRTQNVTSLSSGQALWIDYLNQPLFEESFIGRGQKMTTTSPNKYVICYMTYE